ncbi:MAG: xylulokinase [Rhodanobacteraceae bacterium]
MPLVAGIDLGTQSAKLVLYDPDARSVVATTSAPLELRSDGNGTCEQLAEWWIDAVRCCFAQVEPRMRREIGAIAVSGQQHGFVPVDDSGTVLAPVKLWCDTSTSAECQEIMGAVGGPARCIELVGNPILAGYTASKLPWTRKHRRDAYARMAKILLPHDYLNFFLTGEYFCECGDASGTGWFDVHTRRWSQALLHAIDPQRDLAECLPPLTEVGTTFGLRAAVADELGIPRAAVVAVGGGDNMMAAIGTGVVTQGRLAMSLGTSGTLFCHSGVPMIDAAGAWAAYCSSSGGWLPLICTMNCTDATETVARMFGFSTRDGDTRIAATTPGCDGLTLLPFFSGERTPDLPLGKGVLTGMNRSNVSEAHFYRAAMEGATYSLKCGYDTFVSAGMAFDSLILTGGGSNSAAWRQMVADVFDLRVEVPKQSESAAFGAALQALWSLHTSQGGSTALPELVTEHVAADPALAATPDAARVTAYREPYHRFRDHLRVVQSLYGA